MSTGPNTRIGYGVLHYYRGQMFFDALKSGEEVMDYDSAQKLLELSTAENPGRDIRVVEIHSYDPTGK